MFLESEIVVEGLAYRLDGLHHQGFYVWVGFHCFYHCFEHHYLFLLGTGLLFEL